MQDSPCQEDASAFMPLKVRIWKLYIDDFCSPRCFRDCPTGFWDQIGATRAHIRQGCITYCQKESRLKFKSFKVCCTCWLAFPCWLRSTGAACDRATGDLPECRSGETMVTTPTQLAPEPHVIELTIVYRRLFTLRVAPSPAPSRSADLYGQRSIADDPRCFHRCNVDTQQLRKFHTIILCIEAGGCRGLLAAKSLNRSVGGRHTCVTFGQIVDDESPRGPRGLTSPTHPKCELH
jgi:hypothetical protein